MPTLKPEFQMINYSLDKVVTQRSLKGYQNHKKCPKHIFRNPGDKNPSPFGQLCEVKSYEYYKPWGLEVIAIFDSMLIN